jgi:hypothetical protein
MCHGNTLLARFARAHAQRAIQHLAAIVDNGEEPPAARVAAARALFEVACGRPARVDPAAAFKRPVKIEWGATE